MRQFNDVDAFFDALEEAPVAPLRPGKIISEAQHAAMTTAARLGYAVVLVWDDDEQGYHIRALNLSDE